MMLIYIEPWHSRRKGRCSWVQKIENN